MAASITTNAISGIDPASEVRVTPQSSPVVTPLGLSVPGPDKPAPATPGQSAPAPRTLAELVRAQMIGGAGTQARLDIQTECIAKVVHHEAANQPLAGQLAVAEVILNRISSGRFARTACGVANQAGQFFHTMGYHPKADHRWSTAVAVARVAKSEAADMAAPGALFYHASYVRPAWSHRRQLVARIADQLFYR
jgi:hypothetical protein